MIEDPLVLRGQIPPATDRLLATATALSEADLAGPSLLPGWTRGHVLTHLARNADALANLLEWARTGVPRPAYASRAARDEAIEAGAGRPVADQVDDLRTAADRFADLAGTVPDDAWAVILDDPGGAGPAWWVLWRRWREVEIHHVDLDHGYAPADWPATFAAGLLEEMVDFLTGHPDAPPVHLFADDLRREFEIKAGPGTTRVAASDTTRTNAAGTVRVTGPAYALAAWLCGRSPGSGLTADGPLPAVPPWR